jgi:glyoxylase-like metal-dependent hydrolase (beta-lactamase superfamily II)
VRTGPDGVIVVDSGNGERTSDVIASIRRLSSEPIRYLINTSGHSDHVGGNQALSQAGRPFAGAPGGFNGAGAPVVGLEAVMVRMSTAQGATPAYPVAAWPSETFGTRKSLYLNNEGIVIEHQPAAHSDGDVFVHFRRADVVAAGEIFTPARFPMIDLEHGGSVQGTIDALNRLVELALPQTPLAFREGGTMVIPGRGRISDQADVVEYRDMLTVVRDVTDSLIKKGMSKQQVVAAAPARAYEGRYGATSGAWTTTMFVEAVYDSLTRTRR